MNKNIKNFEDSLITIINNSKLPPSILYYILEAKKQEIGRLFDEALIEETKTVEQKSDQIPVFINIEETKENE